MWNGYKLYTREMKNNFAGAGRICKLYSLVHRNSISFFITVGDKNFRSSDSMDRFIKSVPINLMANSFACYKL